MKALKAFFTKPFETPQRSVKVKIQLNFYFNKIFRNARDIKGLEDFLNFSFYFIFFAS